MTCSVCHSRVAKWLCKCANEVLCEDGVCLGAHFAKTQKAHILVDYGIGVVVSEQEAAACFQHLDVAVETADFVTKEVRWVQSEKDRMMLEVDQRVEAAVTALRQYGDAKKQELSRLTDFVVSALDACKGADRRGFVQEKKRGGKHIYQLEARYKGVETEGWICFVSPGEKVYKLGSQCGKKDWSFLGAVDAITLRASKRIAITGLVLTKASTDVPLLLQSLSILKGPSSTGQPVYTHNSPVTMQSPQAFTTAISLQSEVWIDANREYTVKAGLVGGDGYATGQLRCDEQDGLTIVTMNTEFGDEQDNGSAPNMGIFFEVVYHE